MTVLRFYNLTKGVATFPGVSGTVASGGARTAQVDEVFLDTDIVPLMRRGPDIGLGVFVSTENSVATFDGSAKTQVLLGSAALGAAVRCAIHVGNGATATLMAASAVPADTKVRVLLDTGYATTGTVARAGSDTINGAATSLSLTVSAPLVTLRSDGVSAWVTV